MGGVIFNIQKYSIHDGPGIRTTVFLKGCPLSCSWCHNPESQSLKKEIMMFPNRCIGCGQCQMVCAENAINKASGVMEIDQKLCTVCGSCTEVCFSNAIETVGRDIEADELMKELEKDIIFYDSSKGGITISGGEPLSQAEFTLELLRRCKEKDIHTAVDTCGFGDSFALEQISCYTDLFLFDIKLIDEQRHKEHTGVSNTVILENLKRLSKLGKRIWGRIPVIPGINDDIDNIEKTCQLIKSTGGIEQVNLLPYHNAAMEKYKRLKQNYSLKDLRIPDKDFMDEIAKMYRKQGVNVYIGG